MIDDQVSEEEIAESRRQRQAAQNATDDGMPAAPEKSAAPVVQMQYRTPKHWVKHARKWLGAGGRTLS